MLRLCIRCRWIDLLMLLLLGWGCPPLGAQTRPALGAAFMGSTDAVVPRFGLDMVRPEHHKWYMPRHLPQAYDRSWFVTDTDYSRELYRRYVRADLEGDQWYDNFGNPVVRGWMVYEWAQVQEHASGSSVWKSAEYNRLFQQLIIAHDGGPTGDYRLMIGDRLYTVFTPLTFAKPRFSGMRLDYASDRYRTSVLFSRPSWPDADNVSGTLLPSDRKNFTNLLGGHADFQLGPDLELGLTYVNAHLGQTKQEFGASDVLRGSLTTAQSRTIETLWVRLRDDSPTDGQGGALLFDFDIVLVDTSGRQLRGREIGFAPSVEGGIPRGSSLAADGSETILLTFDLTALDDDVVQAAELRSVTVELFVANDYRVEMASDLQTDAEARDRQPVFLTYARATGNVQDNSNATVLRLDYGLPTGQEVLGLNWNLVNWHGLSLQGEAAMSREHRAYPNTGSRNYHRSSAAATAAYAQLGYQRFPWSLFAEAFRLDADYSTTGWITGGDGQIRFADPTQSRYEFVDDDDDFNDVPEWIRYRQAAHPVAWPGCDENADYLYDYNQNNNLFPDYEEPFLRYRADRPEFLPGLDMNYNGVTDRFEDDEYADYPYRVDHRGANLFASVHIIPAWSVTAGVQRITLISGDGHTRAVYGLTRWVQPLPAAGRLRLYGHLARVRDNIADPVRQWVQPYGASGRMLDLTDRLPARNAWVHTVYADLQHHLGPGVRLRHRMHWRGYRQQDGKTQLVAWQTRRHSGFFGLLDKAEWSIPVGMAVLEPRWKSEYRHQRPHDQRLPCMESLEQTLFLLWTQPLMAESLRVGYFPRYGRQLFATELQVGLERSWLWLLHGSAYTVTSDHDAYTFLAQVVNRTAYQGYQLVTSVGLLVGRRHFPAAPTQRRNEFFFTVTAGLD